MKRVLCLLAAAVLLLGSCAKPPPPAPETVSVKHEHKPPHGGTPVVLGAEIYHLELVRDAAAGTLQAYVFDGELENFIRIAQPELTLVVKGAGHPGPLVLHAVANPATGETIGDTALFEVQADWLKATADFDATVETLTIRGTTFTSVPFNFPKGNDRD
jgi:hypothetical protein